MTFTSLVIEIEIVAPGSLGFVRATGALVGVTTVLSLGLFGTYKLLKRKKLIPGTRIPSKILISLQKKLILGRMMNFSMLP